MRVWFLCLDRFKIRDMAMLSSAMLRREWYGRYASSTKAMVSKGRLSRSGAIPIQSGDTCEPEMLLRRRRVSACSEKAPEGDRREPTSVHGLGYRFSVPAAESSLLASVAATGRFS